MGVEEIMKSALDGECILFLGAGFSVGAKNMLDESFITSSQLCKVLIDKGNIDIEGDEEKDLEDLAYISQRYLASGNTTRDLIGIMKCHFTCKAVAEEHLEMARINWKKIYTTNYDDVMEVASRSVSFLREAVETPDRICDVYNIKNAVIHINGAIGKLTESNLYSNFKLTEQSYKARTIPDSDWAIALRTDIKNAKAVIFIGYSLGYDLELQQIFAADEELKNKSLFVTYNPSKRARIAMSDSGLVYDKGLKAFADEAAQINKTYLRTDKEYELQCLDYDKNKSTNTSVTIKSEDVIKLLVDGIIDENLVNINIDNTYFVERDCVKTIAEFIEREGKVAIIHSDLSNGKTVILNQLKKKLKHLGTVYYLNKIDSRIADDLEYITTLPGIHYIFYENYSQLVDFPEWEIIKKHQYSNIKYIFSSRSYINDNFYMRVVKDLNLSFKDLGLFDVNMLSDHEIKEFIKYMNNYNVWGNHSSTNFSQKKKFLMKECKREIRNILLEVYKSQPVIVKVNEILNIIFRNDTCKDILLMSFIYNIMAINMKYDDIETILGYRVNELYFSQYNEVKELVLLNNKDIKFKSSSIANYVIVKNNYNEDILRLLCKMVDVLVNHVYDPRNISILKLIISFSNLRMVFDRKDKNISKYYINFYENARKTQYYAKNQFFWIQYAIAVMEVEDYSAAKIYLDNASSFSKEKYDEDSYQIESLKARLLLEETMYENNADKAFINFTEAHHLICSNKTPERHYPYRQADHYVKFYNKFYSGFRQEEKVSFMKMCIDMKKRMEEYLRTINTFEKNNTRKNKYIDTISKKIGRLIEKMANETE